MKPTKCTWAVDFVVWKLKTKSRCFSCKRYPRTLPISRLILSLAYHSFLLQEITAIVFLPFFHSFLPLFSVFALPSSTSFAHLILPLFCFIPLSFRHLTPSLPSVPLPLHFAVLLWRQPDFKNSIRKIDRRMLCSWLNEKQPTNIDKLCEMSL